MYVKNSAVHINALTLHLYFLPFNRSGSSVVDNTLDYKSRDRKIDPPLLRSFGLDFKPRYDLVVSGTLNPSSLTHSLSCKQRFSFLDIFPATSTGGQ